MKSKKSIWTSFGGGISSAVPILLSCCKSGACIGVCASPLASLFGVSSSALASSPLVSALEPLLIAISAVSFTISYYSLYVLPKINCATGECACAPDEKEMRKTKIAKVIFWIGLVLSLSFLTYFEYSKYSAAIQQQEHSGACADDEEACCESDSASCEK